MPGLLDNFLSDPNLALGAGLLSPTPSGTFGAGLSQGLNQRNIATAANSTEALRQLEAQLARKRLNAAQSIDETALQKNARAAGFTPGTKSYQDYIQKNMGAKTSPHFTAIPGAQGALVMDARTGSIDFRPYPEQFGGPVAYDPALQREVAAQRQLGLGGAGAITEPATAAAIEEAKNEVKKKIEKPQKTAARESIASKVDLVSDAIDKALDQSSMWTTGLLGSASSWIPGSPAFDLSNTLGTIRSNIGFDKLRELKDAGGTLGQVSDRENLLLQQVWGSVEQAQSEKQLKENLEKVRKQIKESWNRVNNAYKEQYGEPYNGSPAGKPPEGVPQDVWDVMTPQERSLWQ